MTRDVKKNIKEAERKFGEVSKEKREKLYKEPYKNALSVLHYETTRIVSYVYDGFLKAESIIEDVQSYITGKTVVLLNINTKLDTGMIRNLYEGLGDKWWDVYIITNCFEENRQISIASDSDGIVSRSNTVRFDFGYFIDRRLYYPHTGIKKCSDFVCLVDVDDDDQTHLLSVMNQQRSVIFIALQGVKPYLKRTLANNRIFVASSHEEVAQALSLAKMGLAVHKDTGPCTKVARYLACGLPVVGVRVEGSRQWMLDDSNSLTCISDAKVIDQKCTQALEMYKKGKFIPSNIRENHLKLADQRASDLKEFFSKIFNENEINVDIDDFFYKIVYDKDRGMNRHPYIIPTGDLKELCKI